MTVRATRLLLLALALLLVQLGGLLHGLGHALGEKERPHSICELCVAYANLGHAAVAKTPPPMQATHFSPPHRQSAVSHEQQVRTGFLSRAPPTYLV